LSTAIDGAGGVRRCRSGCDRLLDQDGKLIELWSDRRVLDSQYNVLIPDGQDLMGFSSRVRELRRLSSRDAAERWKWYSTVGRGNAIRIGEQMVLLGESGELQLLQVSAAGCEPVGPVQSTGFSQRCFSTPAFAEGLVFVRGEGELIAFRAAE